MVAHPLNLTHSVVHFSALLCCVFEARSCWLSVKEEEEEAEEEEEEEEDGPLLIPRGVNSVSTLSYTHTVHTVHTFYNMHIHIQIHTVICTHAHAVERSEQRQPVKPAPVSSWGLGALLKGTSAVAQEVNWLLSSTSPHSVFVLENQRRVGLRRNMQDVVRYLHTTHPHLSVCVYIIHITLSVCEWHHIQYFYTSGFSGSHACKLQTNTRGNRCWKEAFIRKLTGNFTATHCIFSYMLLRRNKNKNKWFSNTGDCFLKN